MLGRHRETHRFVYFVCICFFAMHLGRECVHAQNTASEGMTSRDFIRLMEEANAARGMGVWTPSPAIQTQADPPVMETQSVPPPSQNPASFPIGSGLASVQQVVPNPVVMDPHPIVHPTPTPQVVPTRDIRTQESPTVSLAYESVWLRRTGDTSTTYSQGGELGTFGEDHSGLVRLGWYANPMERYEFAYLGSLHWNRERTSTGPVDGHLRVDPMEPGWLDNVNQALQHHQAQTAAMRCYELNHRWIADDLSNGFFGFHAIDYQESYSLVSNGNSGNARLNFDTSNLLAGVQGGMELWRPLSQRIAIGGQGVLGLYGNFADGEWDFQRGDGQRLSRTNDSFQLAGAVGFDAKVRYQFTSRLQAFGSYRWWYLGGMATVDDQSVAPIGTSASMDLSTDAGFLLQGAACGLEIVF